MREAGEKSKVGSLMSVEDPKMDELNLDDSSDDTHPTSVWKSGNISILKGRSTSHQIVHSHREESIL